MGVVAHKNRTGDREMPLASEDTRIAIDEEVEGGGWMVLSGECRVKGGGYMVEGGWC